MILYSLLQISFVSYKRCNVFTLLGPLSYNIHTNDLIVCLSDSCDIFNYADDNTICCHGTSILSVKDKLEVEIGKMAEWFKTNHMKLNVDKSQLIIFQKNRAWGDTVSMTVGDACIESQPIVKLLGVQVDACLTFNCHVTEICRKAGRKLNVLARLSRSLDVESKSVLFHTFVLSHFQYCPVVWHFCQVSDMKKIEKMQKQALRYVYNDYRSSYSELREKSGRSLMYVQRLRNMLYEVYKCIYDVGPAYQANVFEVNEGSRSKNGTQLKQKMYKTVTYGKNTFTYQGSKLWNQISPEIKAADNFKSAVNTWSPTCSCQNCDLCSMYMV